MPLYEYKCDECGKIKEAIQKFSDAPLQKCGDCSGKLRRMISNNAFHLKGKGWYATDYGSNFGESSSSSSINTSSLKPEGKTENSKASSKKST